MRHVVQCSHVMYISLKSLPSKCSKTPDGFPAFFLKSFLSSFYSYVNSKLTTSQCIPPLIDSYDNLAVSNHVKCTVLNDYFASVFTADDGLLPEFVPRLSENKSLNCVLFPFDKVLKTLKSLPSKCSKTPDGFPAFFLKSLAPAIAFHYHSFLRCL